MKTKIIVLAVLAFAIAVGYAVGLNPVDIPDPKYTVSEAIRLVEDHKAKADYGDARLVSIDWCRADQYEAPRWISGFSSISDKNWSWFLCYARRGDTRKGFRDVIIFRVQESGEVGGIIPPRT
jgi:hypothetical protein